MSNSLRSKIWNARVNTNFFKFFLFGSPKHVSHTCARRRPSKFDFTVCSFPRYRPKNFMQGSLVKLHFRFVFLIAFPVFRKQSRYTFGATVAIRRATPGFVPGDRTGAHFSGVRRRIVSKQNGPISCTKQIRAWIARARAHLLFMGSFLFRLSLA